MEIYNVCRLCLSIDDLVYIFNEDNIKLKMRDVISITTGIEIHTKDIISQKVCGTCYQFIIQILQFRSQCLKSETYLKDICVDYFVDQKCYIPNTEVSIKKSIVKQEVTPQIKPNLTKLPSINEIHPSIIKLSRTYPEIILPGICLTLDVAPIVQMKINQVENYFEKSNLDFNLHVKKALLSAKKSEKATKNSKIQNPSEESVLISMLKEVNVNKISGTSKPEKERHSETDNETRNISKEVCGTPKKNPRNNSLQSNPKRQLIESSPKRTVDKAHVETGAVILTPNRKRKRDQNQKTVTNKIYGNCSATTRKRKLVLTENEETIDIGVVPSIRTPKSSTNKKSCATKEKPMEEKRQLTDSEKHSEVSNEKNDTCSYQSDDYESLTSVGKSKPLVVCQICNSVYYNMHDLKKHHNKHMRCQFCKARFRSLEKKKLHVDNVCLIRKMMIDLPDVALARIESDRVIRERYSEAFAEYSLHEQVSLMEIERGFNNSPVDETFFRGFPSEKIIVCDETVISLPRPNKKHPPIVPNISTNVFNVMQEKASKNKVLKSLLNILPSTITEGEMHNNLPTNDDINKIENDTVVLRSLLTYTSLYKIPVTVRHGIFNVTYDYTIKPKPITKMHLWNDLTPITIKSRDEGCGSSKAMTETSSKETVSSSQ